MVDTRSKKRKSDIVHQDTNITYNIKKKVKTFSENSDSESASASASETESDLFPEETESQDPNYDNENDNDDENNDENDKENDNYMFDTRQIQEIIKNSIKNIVKSYKGESKEPKNVEYDKFNDMVYSIYDGNFFERVPVEDKKNKMKELYTKEQVEQMTKELELIKENYYNNCPSIIDILKMNVSLEQKQKLLEKMYSFINSDVLTPEYNSNLKFLTSNITNGTDPELLKLEEKILQTSINNGFADSYRMKILKSKMSFENKVIAYKKLEIMETYEETDTSEYAKYKAWMDSLLSIPFGVYNDTGITSSSDLNDNQAASAYIKNVRSTLDQKLSFLEKPKDQIINIVTQMMRNPNVNINAIGLYGGPGVGKTSIAQSIASSLNRPFRMISLGGESDATSLTGHGFTYVGSGSGRLINTLVDTKIMNPVILIDECDKISETQQGKEIIGTLIHLTDTTTNNKYNHDKYFAGIEFDLSKVLFIFTYNDPTKVDKILADRLFKINVDNYSFKEKLEITNKHIIKYMLEKFNFTNSDISFTDDALTHLVQSSNKSDGMRDIKTKIKIIFSRINTLLLTNEMDNIINLKYKKLYSSYKTLPVIIPKEHIDIFLDESISTEDKSNKPPEHMYI